MKPRILYRYDVSYPPCLIRIDRNRRHTDNFPSYIYEDDEISIYNSQCPSVVKQGKPGIFKRMQAEDRVVYPTRYEAVPLELIKGESEI